MLESRNHPAPLRMIRGNRISVNLSTAKRTMQTYCRKAVCLTIRRHRLNCSLQVSQSFHCVESVSGVGASLFQHEVDAHDGCQQ